MTCQSRLCCSSPTATRSTVHTQYTTLSTVDSTLYSTHRGQGHSCIHAHPRLATLAALAGSGQRAAIQITPHAAGPPDASRLTRAHAPRSRGPRRRTRAHRAPRRSITPPPHKLQLSLAPNGAGSAASGHDPPSSRRRRREQRGAAHARGAPPPRSAGGPTRPPRHPRPRRSSPSRTSSRRRVHGRRSPPA